MTKIAPQLTPDGLLVTLSDGSTHMIPFNDIVPRALREAKRRADRDAAIAAERVSPKDDLS
jgi:hypothetical protein